MTESQRHAAISALIKDHVASHTISQEVARTALIKEGIYNAKGELMPEFGGTAPSKKAAKKAA